VLKRHRTIGRHIGEHKQLQGMASAVVNNDENTTKNNKFITIKTLKSTVKIYKDSET